jgi:endonuclease/exonuclease/phosphatase family metal-dependent hydrolase
MRSVSPSSASAPLAALVLLAALATPAHALRVVAWNLLAYDDAAVPGRRPHMIQVVPGLNPDVMIVQELLTAPAADSFANLLEATMPGKVWKGGSSTFILGTQSAFYYDSLVVSLSNLTAVTTGGPRQVEVALIRPNGYKANAASFRVYSVHFKAGDGGTTPTDSSTRHAECTNLRNNLNTAPAGTNILLGGDTNFYGSYESGYARLTESQLDNDGRLRDPLSLAGVWNNPSYAPYHTQSPCAGSPCIGSPGGMDDRFDLFLHSYPLNDGAGLDVVAGGLPGGYGPYGNDGLHYNLSLDDGGNAAVGTAIAGALRLSSDHIPVIVTLQLPAKLAVVHALDFGDVITGAAPTAPLTVDNLPAPPAATLTYSLAAPAGFTAPGGSFNNPAAAAPDVHAIGMASGSVGPKSGTLTINSNDLDTTAKAVLLTGRVLAHAAPSLDSLVATASDTLDFGTVPQGSTTELSLRLFNLGYDPLQARLARSAEFVAGTDRFEFDAPAALLTDAGTYAVRFDAVGATPNSDHVAELRLAPADEPLPGAIAHDTVRVTLKAHVAPNDDVELPATLRFAPPAPNPFRGTALFGFDLPEAAPVSLAIFDAGGRRVAELASGEYPAGRHQVRWTAEGRALHAGLYFARFRTPGLTRVARLVMLP